MSDRYARSSSKGITDIRDIGVECISVDYFCRLSKNPESRLRISTLSLGGTFMNKLLLLTFFVLATLCCGQISSAAEPGTTGTVFNKRLLPSIKPMLTYAQIATLAGAPGAKIAESKKTSPPTIQYRWKGGKDSILIARFANNRMVDATVRVPNGKTFAIRRNGKIDDLGNLD
ncbi:MAG: hypothetical protein AB9919_10280 [Geobacteraceae bacterium]